MKIARIETLHADGGWRPWTFVRIETDDGLVGWGECSDNRSPLGIAGCVRDLEDLLLGQDPRPVERLYWDMLRRTRQIGYFVRIGIHVVQLFRVTMQVLR